MPYYFHIKDDRVMKLTFKIIAFSMLLTPLSGCETVRPWERDILARDSMALDPAPMASSLRRHVRESREASAGGSDAQGGGCGCN